MHTNDGYGTDRDPLGRSICPASLARLLRVKLASTYFDRHHLVAGVLAKPCTYNQSVGNTIAGERLDHNYHKETRCCASFVSGFLSRRCLRSFWCLCGASVAKRCSTIAVITGSWVLVWRCTNVNVLKIAIRGPHEGLVCRAWPIYLLIGKVHFPFEHETILRPVRLSHSRTLAVQLNVYIPVR